MISVQDAAIAGQVTAIRSQDAAIRSQDAAIASRVAAPRSQDAAVQEGALLLQRVPPDLRYPREPFRTPAE